MIIIGIDFSIRYPSLCISTDFEDFQFATVVNTKVSDKRRKEVAELLGDITDVSIDYPINHVSMTDDTYHIEQRNKTLNYIRLIQSILNNINQHVIPGDPVIVAIEGIAYGAKGNSLLDICIATGMLRSSIVTDVLHAKADQFFVFSPSELKNAIGCKGNAPKNVIFDKFLDDPVISDVKDSQLHKYLVKNVGEHIVRNGDKIESPWNDMVDAYLAVLKIYNILNNS